MYQDAGVIVLHDDLDPSRDMLKRQLDRVHLILSDPLSSRALKELLHESMLGTVVLSLGTERFLWKRLESRMGQHLKGKINPKRGRPRKRRRKKHQ